MFQRYVINFGGELVEGKGCFGVVCGKRLMVVSFSK